MNEINITIPAIDPSVIESIKTETEFSAATEVEAIRALREKYAPLARHNGFVRIGWTYRGDGSNWAEEKDYHYERDGKRVCGFLAYDGFEKTHTDRNRGRRVGDRLYLLETGDWLRIEQDGDWSAFQGVSEEWACGSGIIDEDLPPFESDIAPNAGSIRVLTDSEVADRYELASVVGRLSKSLATLAEKLPERLTRIRQRTELASKLLASLK